MNPNIFRLYDIRGRYPEDLDEDVAYKIGIYFGKLAIDGYILVGYDGRLSSGSLYSSLMQGIEDAGGSARSLGLVTTPVLYFMDKMQQPVASIMITASHSPTTHNGFKMLFSGKPFFGEKLEEIKKYIESSDKNVDERTIPGMVGIQETCDPYEEVEPDATAQMDSRFCRSATGINNGALPQIEAYLDKILENINVNSKLKIAWDSGNGASCHVVEALLKRLPNKNIHINSTVDGSFPNRPSDQMVPGALDALISTVKQYKCDLGISFDGDGDRIVFISSSGELLTNDHLLCIFADEILQANPGATVIADVKTSQTFFDYVARLGGKAIMSKTGHAFIKDLIQKTGALFAGELSGHIFFADKYYGFDDGLYAALRMIDLLTTRHVLLDDLRQALPRSFITGEIKVPVKDEKKFDIIDQVKAKMREMGRDFIDTDGIRYSTLEGWWLLRASNTESSIIARCESMTKEGLDIIRKDLEQFLPDSI